MLRRLTAVRIGLLVGLAIAAARLGGCQYIELIDLRGLDYRFLQRGPRPGVAEVVILAIDDASVNRVGRWPWPRGVIAKLLDRVSADGAAVVGFDIVQSEATHASIDVDGLRAHLPDVDARTWAALSAALRYTAGDDERLADAVRASGRAVLGYFFDFEASADGSPPIRVSDYNIVQHSGSGRGERQVPLGPVAQGNLPALTAAARELGYFNFVPDPDGSYRRAPLAIRYGDTVALPLSLAMLRVYRPDAALAIRFGDSGVESLRIGTRQVPVGEHAELLLNFRGGGGSFPHVSAADVLEDRVAAGTFRDKLVLVGVTAAAVADVRVMPFDAIFPGVEIHANVLDNILRDDFLLRPKAIVLAEAGLVVVMTVVLGWMLHRVRGFAGAALTVLVFVGYLVGSQWLFVEHGVPLSLVYPLAAIAFTYTAVGVHHYVVEEREKRKIRDAFGLYLNPHLAERVAEHPEMLALGGEKRDLTVLFSDIRGFTTLSEGLEPEALVELLNEYLGEMTDVVFAHDGTLDKYIGDAIMAVWGAPVTQPDHAARACRAALGMVEALRALTVEWERRGVPVLQIGIGLNTGPMVVGNMGSARRLSYTVIGDNVNLGSRLEGLTKTYGSPVIASESTVLAAGPGFVTRELDLVRVKGKRLPVRIFEVLGVAAATASWGPLVDQFHAAIAAYRARQWADALRLLEAVRVQYPHDGPSRLYMERCQALLAAPPGPEWDAVTVMEAK